MGSGESGPMGTKCPSAASPVAFWLLCRHGQSNSPRRAKPSPHLQKEKGKWRREAEKREKSPSQILRRPVLEGLGQVLGLDVLRAVQIGDGPGHPADAVVAAGGEAHAGEGPLEDGLAVLVQGAAALQALGLNLGVAPAALPLSLDGPGLVHPLLDGGGGLGGLPAGELLKLQGGHLHKQVDAVQQGAGQAGEVKFCTDTGDEIDV